ncbi:MAG: protein-S-isoprenylcysteine methyltransferase, partial [Sphingomonadales bacterium]|nr:protein-S-isoprenylcysteine methyltransferase [Sphingomonadales bacterium]
MSDLILIRPKSAVSTGVGLSGLAGLLIWFVIARTYGLSGPLSALANVVACGTPMVLWSVLIDRVHRNSSTGIDWDNSARPLSETLDISISKLAGLWATWALIACLYGISRFYWVDNYYFSMRLLTVTAPFLFVASVPYVIWIDTRLKHPR